MDETDIRLIEVLLREPDLPQRTLAERINLSQNACWRRLRKLEEAGIIEGRVLRLGRQALGLNLVVFTMIRTRNHSAQWLEDFRRHVQKIPEVIDFYRIAGNYDYLLKIVARDMAAYDAVYQRLIRNVELDDVTSYFAMEAIAEDRPPPVR